MSGLGKASLLASAAAFIGLGARSLQSELPHLDKPVAARRRASVRYHSGEEPHGFSGAKLMRRAERGTVGKARLK
jgi:hypothetical protein